MLCPYQWRDGNCHRWRNRVVPPHPWIPHQVRSDIERGCGNDTGKDGTDTWGRSMLCPYQWRDGNCHRWRNRVVPPHPWIPHQVRSDIERGCGNDTGKDGTDTWGRSMLCPYQWTDGNGCRWRNRGSVLCPYQWTDGNGCRWRNRAHMLCPYMWIAGKGCRRGASYYSTTPTTPALKPAAPPTRRTLLPGPTTPSSMASARAMGMLAEAVLPYFLTVSMHFLIGMFI